MNRFAVFGIPGDELSSTIRGYQKNLSAVTGDRRALRFPVHVTLRGPFRTDAARLVGLIESLRGCCRSHGSFPVTLHGPVFVEPDLCWFEIKTGSTGFSTCLDLHTRLENLSRPLVLMDDVPADHKGADYRPHVTLGWNVHASARQLLSERPGDLSATINSIALVRYPDDWPARGTVRAIESIALNTV